MCSYIAKVLADLKSALKTWNVLSVIIAKKWLKWLVFSNYKLFHDKTIKKDILNPLKPLLYVFIINSCKLARL